MPLQVWLPLNGNLNNQGLADVNALNYNGCIVENNGKIGKCYRFNGNSCLTLDCNIADFMNNYINKKSFSVCLWFKTPGLGTNQTLNSLFCISYGIRASVSSSGVNFTLYNTTKTVSLGANGAYQDNNWHHVMFTVEASSGMMKIYMDGVLSGSQNYNGLYTSSWVNAIHIGNDMNNSMYHFNGYMNDFRIYDHCLSTKEVKEISKGLCLHYPMNQCLPYANLAKNPTSYTIYNNYGVPSTLVKLPETYQGCDVYRLTQTPTSSTVSHFKSTLSSHGVYGFGRTFKASTKYCFWIYYRPISHFNIRVGGTASNISGWTEIPPQYYKDGWYRVGQYRNGSVTSDKTDKIFTSYCVSTAAADVPIIVDFCCPHLVEGSSEIIEEYDYQDTGDTTVYDCSGFGYDGVVTNSPALDFNSPRHDTCYKFNGVDSNIIVGSGINYLTTGGSNPISYAFWIKPNDTGRNIIIGDYNTSGAIGFNIEYDGSGVRWYWDSSPDKYFNIKTATNTWMHVCLVYNGISISAYKNGELIKRYSFTLPARTKTSGNYLIGKDGRSGETVLNGCLSDFRIYATALSAEDVLTLYKSSMSIDNVGNLYCSEIIENEEENLVTNADFADGTKHWSGSNLVLDSVSNSISATGNLYHDELIPCWNKDKYEISFDFKCNSGTSNNFYIALQPYDSDKSFIEIWRVSEMSSNRRTTLAKAINHGDTTVTLTSAANWDCDTTYRHLGICNDSAWKYKRATITLNYTSISGNVLTLKTAYSGNTIAAGTAVSEFTSGATHFYPVYFAGAYNIKNWTSYKAVFNGGDAVRNTAQYVKFSTLGESNNYSIRNIKLTNITSYQSASLESNQSFEKTGIIKVNEFVEDSGNIILGGDVYYSNANYNICNYNLTKELEAGKTYTAILHGELGQGKSYFGIWLGGGYRKVGEFAKTANSNIYSLSFIAPSKITGDNRRDRINIYTVDGGVSAVSTITSIYMIEGTKIDTAKIYKNKIETNEIYEI